MVRLFRFALLCLVVLAPLSAAAGFTFPVNLKLQPSNLGGSKTFSQDQTFSLFHYISCFNVFTGDPIRCTFSYQVTGIAPGGFGGHAHDTDTHPVIWPADGSLKYNLTDYPPLAGIPESEGATLGDAGSDVPGTAEVHYVMPEVAGEPQVELFIVTPPGWFCVAACYTYNSWHYLYTLDIGVQDLVELPAGSYYNLSGDTGGHLSNHYGLLEMDFRIAEAAARYYSDPTLPGNPKVGVNDISLPEGGLLDLNFDWKQPHQTHRKGTEVDFDRVAALSNGSLQQVDADALNDASAAAGLVLHLETAPTCPVGTDDNPWIHLDLNPAF
jgi:hypothetical protein